MEYHINNFLSIWAAINARKMRKTNYEFQLLSQENHILFHKKEKISFIGLDNFQFQLFFSLQQ
jgi:hypothetical protein